MSPKRLALSAVGGLVAAGLLWTWWQRYGDQIHGAGHLRPGLLVAAVACLCTAIGLQLVRTGLLLQTPARRLARPLLLAHGMNIWLPSMMGDLFEVWAVAKISGQTKRAALVWLIHRFAGTLAALGLLAAFALCGAAPSWAVLLGAGAISAYLLVDQTIGQWSTWLRLPAELHAPLGPARTLGHLSLAVLQHGIEAAGIFMLALGLSSPVAPSAAAAMVSMIELLTYLPIPLGGAGASHWGGSQVLDWIGTQGSSALLVAATHATHLGLGALAIGAASMLPGDGAPAHTA
jgi:hypothetical protein